MATSEKRSVPKSAETPNRRSSSGAKKRTGHWALNLRLLVKTLIAVAVLAPAAYFWHARQVHRNASGLLVLATKYEQSTDWDLAAQTLHRYLQLEANDSEARIRLAEDYDRGAKTARQKLRAVELYGTAISLAPERDDLRRRQMVLQLEAGNYRAALDQAEHLLARQGDDPEAWRVKAIAMHLASQRKGGSAIEDVIAAFETALEKDASGAELAAELARIYRTELALSGAERDAAWKKADEVLDRLVESSSKKPQAYLARYLYRRQFTLPGADADLDRAVSADAQRSDWDVQWQAGSRALAQGDWSSAAAYFERSIEIDPGERRGYLGLGQAQSGQGQDEFALRSWQRGLDQTDATDIELQLQAAAAHLRLAQWENADKQLDALERQTNQIYGPAHGEVLARVSLLRAETRLGQDAPVDAVALFKQALQLEQAGAESPGKKAFKYDCLQRLGQAYWALQRWDQAAASYQQAADLEPAVASVRLAAARAWELAGRRDEAARAYEDALALPGVEPTAWLDFARVEFQRQLTLPPAERNWSGLGNVLSRAKKALPEAVALELLEAEYLTVQGQGNLAVEMLHGIEAKALDEEGLAGPLAIAYERAARPEEADRVVELLRRRDPDSPQALLLSADLLSRRNRQKEAAELLAAAIPNLPRDEQRDVLYRLAMLRLALGDLEQARSDLQKLADDDPRDIRPLQFLAELSLQSADWEDVAQREGELQSRAGDEGTSWRFYRAQRLIAEAAAAEKNDAGAGRTLLAEAERLQKEIERLRPTWAPGYLLKARLAQQLAVPDDNAAIQAYVQALKLGESRISSYEALIMLLFRQNRIGEADDYLERLRQTVNLPPELAPVAMAIDVKQGNLQRAIELARRGVDEEPESAIQHLRLGYLLSLVPSSDDAERQTQRAGAEAELKKARELAPDDVRTWSSLLSFYVSTQQTDAARELLDELKRDAVLPADDQALFLARGYAALGDDEQARAGYVQALAAAPDRVDVQLQAAQFFYNRDPDQAEQCLRRVREIDPANRAASRLLAMLLAARGGTESTLEEVWRLLDAEEAPDTVAAIDQRLKAILLLRRGGSAHREQARALLEALAADPQRVAPIDRLLLARLYEALGEMAAAREQLQVLVNTERPAADHLAAYVDNLLRADRAKEAAGSLDELAKLEPETTHFRTLSLRARWLKAQDQTAQVTAYVEEFLNHRLPQLARKPDQAQLQVNVARLFDGSAMPAEAELYFARAVELDPATHPQLANWLVQQGRTREAVRLCLRIAATDQLPLAAATLNSVLAIGKPTSEDRAAAEPVLKRAIEQDPKNVGLLFAASSRSLMEGDDDEAIRLLRQVLQINPRLQPALNNLAMLLARRPDGRQEALQCIERAIALAGMVPELVDSKGWVMLEQGDLGAAESLFKEAVSVPPGDARHHFHLALVYQLQRKLPEAQQAWQAALDHGLEKSVLSPDERAEYNKLETALR